MEEMKQIVTGIILILLLGWFASAVRGNTGHNRVDPEDMDAPTCEVDYTKGGGFCH